MKRIFSWISILVVFSLSACNLMSGRDGGQPPVVGTPTISNEQALTQIAQVLNATETPGALPEMTETSGLPTVVVITATQSPEQAGSAPTDAPASQPTDAAQPAAPTATLAPQATATSGPAPTATVPAGPTFTPPPGDPRGRLGAPTSTDPMNNDQAWVWPTGTDQYTTGTFSNGVQVITALTGTDGWRLANPAGRDFTNLYLEATIRTNTCSGSDHYGIIARVPVIKDANQGYLFGLTCDGKYSLRRWDSKIGQRGEMRWLVHWTASPAIATGSNQINRLGIYTVGSRLIMYVNGTLLQEVQDATFQSGYFGIFIGSDNTNQMSIQVDEMSYWENPQP